MRVKRYVVDSMPDALQKIKADLGKDAIILNTKNIKTGGFMGLFTKKQIEVIAAVDVKTNPAQPTSTGSIAPSSSLTEERKTRQPFSPTPQAIQREGEKKETQFYDLKSVVARKTSPQADSITPPLQEWAARPASGPGTEVAFGGKVQETIDFTPIRTRLTNQEVEEQWIEEIMKRMTNRYPAVLLRNEQSQVQHAKLVIEEILTEKQRPHHLIDRKTRIVEFFGPTGVGKTTTIAKLAAEGVLKNKRKVGFITTDTYRIGAVDQLRTYANILNIPLEVVFQPNEMITALDNLRDCDLLFVDTAGRNYRNQEYANELFKYFPNKQEIDHYIVLSLTAKNRDMIEILDNFSHLSIEKVIFTKADETQTYGSILNMICRFNLSLSYLTTGQNVPDDIRIAAPSKVANLMLGEDRYA